MKLKRAQGAVRCRGYAAASTAVLLWSGLASAHILDARHDLDGFVRRADVIVRGKVVEATRSEKPEHGMFPLVTQVLPEKIYRGEAVGKAPIRVRGGDDHAARYKVGLSVLLFLQGRPGKEHAYPADQQKGEEILLAPADVPGWDAYFAAVLPAIARKPELITDAGYRAAMFDVLGASATHLREHALRRCSLWLASATVPRGEVELALGVFRDRGQPDRHRLAILRALLRHLTAQDLARLTGDGGERPMVRGTLLEVWAQRASEAKAPAGDREAATTAFLAALGEPDATLRVMAAAALSRFGDLRALKILREFSVGADLRFKRVAITGLGRLSAAGRMDARALLIDAKTREQDTRVLGWLRQALPDRDSKMPASGFPTELWVGVGLGAALLVALAVWATLLRRRRRQLG